MGRDKRLWRDAIVLQKRGEQIYVVEGKFDPSNGELRTRDGRLFVVPPDYKPKILVRKKLFRTRIAHMFLVDDAGNLVGWDAGNFEKQQVDTEVLGAIIDSEIIKRLAGSIYLRVTDIIAWLLAGLGIAFVIVFVVFPLIGIHVGVGDQTVVVNPQVTIQQPQTSVPPAGNYTIGG